MVSVSLQHAQIVLKFHQGSKFAGMQIEERCSFGVFYSYIHFMHSIITSQRVDTYICAEYFNVAC